MLHRRARLSQADGAQHGAERFSACTTLLLDQAERLARSAIAQGVPDGTYEFTDWIDEDGIDPDPDPDRGRGGGRRATG